MPELPVRMESRFNPDELIELGKEVLRIEAEAVLSLVNRLGPTFVDAARLISKI